MNRIQFIASLLQGYDIAIDIGSDHGLVLKYALDNNYIQHAVASDLNEGPLNHAKQNLTGYPVRFYLSDGFKNVPLDYDIAVITGMGPHLILDILKNVLHLEGKTYILGANDKVEVLREGLMQLGFKIIDEYVIHDGFYYVFLKVVIGKMTLTQQDIYVGPILKHKPEAKSFFEHKYNYYLDLSKKVTGHKLKEIKTILKFFTFL